MREKLKESLISVVPVSLLVFLLSVTPWVDISRHELLVFAGAAILLVAGISLFNLGADMAMTPMGQHIGEGLTKSKKAWAWACSCSSPSSKSCSTAT